MSFPQDRCSSPAKVPAARLPFLLPPGRREELGSLHVVLVGLDTPSENKFYRLLMVVIKESFSNLWIRIQDRCLMKIFRNPKNAYSPYKNRTGSGSGSGPQHIRVFGHFSGSY
jgi:hypothetical protein